MFPKTKLRVYVHFEIQLLKSFTNEIVRLVCRVIYDFWFDQSGGQIWNE